MPKLTLNDIQNLENSETAKNTINNNSAATETALEKTLSRDGTNPNQMEADLDMNSNRIINLPSPIDPTEPVRKKDIQFLTGADDSIALAAAVDAAEDAAADAADQSALAKKWATNPVDVPVTTPPDEFSARHWAIKAQQAIITTAFPVEVLTADKIWYVGLNGNDTTGDGTHDNPWYSVWKAQHHIISRVNCNGFAPVIQMFDGTYNILNDGQGGYTGFTPPGFLTWDIFPNVPIEGNTVARGGALMELCEPLHGSQITGGQPIRLCSAGAPNRSGDNCIINSERYALQNNPDVVAANAGTALISVLHGGKLIIASMTFRSTRICPLIYATQGGAIELGANVVFAGGLGTAIHADNGGTIVTTGNMQISGSTGQYFAQATGGGSSVAFVGPIDLQYVPGGYALGGGSGPHHWAAHFLGAHRGGAMSWTAFAKIVRTQPAGEPPVNTTNQSQLGVAVSKYLVTNTGGLNGVSLVNAIPGGVVLGNSIQTATFGWST